jgi:hypothetical protein
VRQMSSRELPVSKVSHHCTANFSLPSFFSLGYAEFRERDKLKLVVQVRQTLVCLRFSRLDPKLLSPRDSNQPNAGAAPVGDARTTVRRA